MRFSTKRVLYGQKGLILIYWMHMMLYIMELYWAKEPDDHPDVHQIMEHLHLLLALYIFSLESGMSLSFFPFLGYLDANLDHRVTWTQ